MSLLWTLLVIFHWLFYAFSDDLWIRVRLVSVWSSHRSLRTHSFLWVLLERICIKHKTFSLEHQKTHTPKWMKA